jgi:hypothetical protein
LLSKIANHDIIQLPGNYIPRGLVPLERLFDGNDVEIKGRVSGDDADTTECNIGTSEEPKFVKLSTSLTEEQRIEYIELLREFVDVFAWTYKDLKTYDTSVIQAEAEVDKSHVATCHGERSEEIVRCPNHCPIEVF